MKSLNIIIITFLINFITQCTSTPNCEPLILTHLIESRRINEAKKRSAVHNLPNAPNMESYSGFLTVDKKYNSNMYFWFFPALKNSESTPVLLWLQGGPGSSSMSSLFLENGPYRVDENLNVHLNNYSWTQEFSMLYIDNPVGTGFSYTLDENGYSKNQNQVANNLYEALQQFFTLFSEYRKNDFYLTGQSYAGKYVPAIGYKLHLMSKISKINFKGIAIGNAFIDPINMLDYGSFLKSIGLIDENQSQQFYSLQNRVVSEIQKGNFSNAWKLSGHLLVHGPNDTSLFENMTGLNYFHNYLKTEPPKEFKYYSKYLNLKKTQEAIHVGCVLFTAHNSTVSISLGEDIYRSVKPWFQTLINKYKVLIYNGNLDIIIAVPLTDNFLKNLVWKYSKEFYSAKRYIWKVSDNDTEIAGYAKSHANFTQVVVRNAGHIVVFDQPRAALDMIKRFVNSRSFEL